jgi:hypothetical protein
VGGKGELLPKLPIHLVAAGRQGGAEQGGAVRWRLGPEAGN